MSYILEWKYKDGEWQRDDTFHTLTEAIQRRNVMMARNRAVVGDSEDWQTRIINDKPSSVLYQSDSEWIAYSIEWRYTAKNGDTPDAWRWYVQDNRWEDGHRITTSPYCFQRLGDAYDYMKKMLRHDGRHEYRVVELKYVRGKAV